MAGRVFISCGQRPPDERRVAEEIAKILKDEFDLTPYLAFKIQSLNDIMTITKELRKSDYYLFIDFLRKSKNLLFNLLKRTNNPQDLPCSLFTHQELALAHHLGFENIIALQQRGTPLEGFLRYVLSNPEPFDDEKDLFHKVRRLVKDRGWTKDYSRNLVIEEIGFTDVPWYYTDHTGTSYDLVWQLKVENRRPDVAAVGTVCILNYIISGGNRIDSPDRAYLKWARQAGYDRTIIPKDFGVIDLFAIRDDCGGIFLHSLRDAVPREPVLLNDGDYELFFMLFSQGFPLLEFSVDLKLRWTRAGLGKQAQSSTGKLVNP